MKKIILLYLVFSLSSCHFFWFSDYENSPIQVFDSLWTGFNNSYALFQVRGIDWNETREKYKPLISPDMSNIELFKVCSEMLNSLQDPHVSLIAPFGASYALIDIPPASNDFFDFLQVGKKPDFW